LGQIGFFPLSSRLRLCMLSCAGCGVRGGSQLALLGA
jgi:hypothetical protein